MGNDANKKGEAITEKYTWPGWKIVSLLGEGSYGRVYEIQRKEDDIVYPAALKIIHIPKDEKELQALREEGMDDQSIRSYLESKVKDIKAEYALMARLRSCPNIVIYDDHKVIEKEDGMGWVVMIKMELLTEFRKYVKEVGVSESLVQKVGIDLCKALEACQEEGIVHRDIKPGNMFINHYRNIKLGDFGVARKMDHTSTMMTRIGTYPYMAPEIYHGQPAGFAADIYSVGMVMYRLLNNNIGPFETTLRTTKSQQEAQDRRFRGEPLPYPRNGSRELQNIVMRALAFRATDRFRSAFEMRKALESVRVNSGEIPTTGGWDDSDSSSRRRREEEERRKREEERRRLEEERQREEEIRKREEERRRLEEEERKKQQKLIFGLFGVFAVAVLILLVLLLKRTGVSRDGDDLDSSTETYSESATPGESAESPDAPKLLVDSTVILLGDTIPIRFFDGKNTYANVDGLSYYSHPNTVTIGTDSLHYRNYITADSKGKTTVIGTKDGQKLEKEIYVLDPGIATNSVLCDTEKIVFGVTASGPGAANITLSVEGKKGEALEARVYTNVGRDKSRNVWVTSTGEWDDNVLNLTVTNYLSPDKTGELVVVITPKGDPSTLIGLKRIPLEVG